MGRRRAALVALCGVVLALTGCGGDSAPRETPSETSAESAEIETQIATIDQWASLIAEGAGPIREYYGTWERQCLPGETDPICTSGLLTMGLGASTLESMIEGGRTAGVPAYIGEVPEEIQRLVDETSVAAAEASAAAQSAGDECTADGEDCLSSTSDAFMKYGTLLAKLNAWGPYGVTS